jgi:diaminopimelate decarboxylase
MKIFQNLSIIKRVRTEHLVKYKKKGFSTYFLHGTDNRQLPYHMQNQLNSLIRYTDPNSSSFLIYNSHEAQRKIKNWKTTLPWIHAHYAIKSNPITPLLEDLHHGGAGFDCASKKEIQLALDVGAEKENIVYSNSVKEVSSLKFAHKNKIYLTTADTLDELEKINEVAPKMKILWRLSIKEDNSETLKTVFSNKFGDDLDSVEEAEERFRQIRSMGIKLEGIHFHCGSGQNGSSSFKKAIKTAQACMEIGRKHGHNMETLDLGGGFPAGDLNEVLVDALELTQNSHSLGYRVIAEPGRHFSSNTCYLATKVIGKRIKDGKLCYHINDSLYHSFNCILMDGVSFEMSNDQFYSAVEGNGKKVSLEDDSFKIGSIFGMTCDGHDVIAKSIALPQNINVGDWLIIGGMGAYTVGPKSTFNGMEATKKIIRWIAPVDAADEQQSGIFMDTQQKISVKKK